MIAAIQVIRIAAIFLFGRDESSSFVPFGQSRFAIRGQSTNSFGAVSRSFR
ncbi:hypothetical protein RISK_001448 [Rhodopirellula islandica]|uniref:Uncharacterized protein n=1 Tax=Rhodopirellula islandica TaxID=595434 RepID=A0A0J1BI72_RHOIS|nr:hypothetical protein RISK_001448 [Rhodopirellula islandica]